MCDHRLIWMRRLTVLTLLWFTAVLVLIACSPSSPPATAIPTSTPQPTAIPLPIEVVAPGWRFLIQDADMHTILQEGSRTHTPRNGAFLVLIGELENLKSEYECLRSDDWKVADVTTGAEYEFASRVDSAVKAIYQLDYPGSFLGICMDGRQKEPIFAVFDVELLAEYALWIGEDDTNPVVLGMAHALAQAPTATPTATATPTITPTPAPSATATPTYTPLPTLTASATATATPIPLTLRVVPTSINFRAGPGTSYPVLTTLQAGDTVTVIAISGDGAWYNVRTAAGKIGWLGASVVEVVGGSGENDVPVAVTVPAPPTPTNTPRPPNPTPVPNPPPTNPPPPSSNGGCCRVCSVGKACGNSCINRNYTCHQPPGCACNAATNQDFLVGMLFGAWLDDLSVNELMCTEPLQDSLFEPAG